MSAPDDFVRVFTAAPGLAIGESAPGRAFRTLTLGAPPPSAPPCVRCFAVSSVGTGAGELCRPCLNALVKAALEAER